MTGRFSLALALALLMSVLVSGCGRKRGTSPAPARPLPVQGDVRVGDCADPAKEGVVGEAPSLDRADRDLNDDGNDEVVVAARGMCTKEGNCHWNLYRTEGECHRYLGTVSASGIQRIPPRGEDGFYGLRGFWRLTGDGRVLLQEYRFRRGGYRLVEAVLCRQADDDRILCEEQGR